MMEIICTLEKERFPCVHKVVEVFIKKSVTVYVFKVKKLRYKFEKTSIYKGPFESASFTLGSIKS